MAHDELARAEAAERAGIDLFDHNAKAWVVALWDGDELDGIVGTFESPVDAMAFIEQAKTFEEEQGAEEPMRGVPIPLRDPSIFRVEEE